MDTLNVTVWLPGDAFETRYVLLIDGTVWKWEFDVGAYLSLFIFMVGPIAGFGTSIIVVVVLWAVIGLKRHRYE